jgi:hypothetical protein
LPAFTEKGNEQAGLGTGLWREKMAAGHLPQDQSARRTKAPIIVEAGF